MISQCRLGGAVCAVSDLRHVLSPLVAIIISSCATVPEPSEADRITAECMAEVLKASSGVDNVTTKFVRQDRLLLSWTFRNSSSRSQQGWLEVSFDYTGGVYDAASVPAWPGDNSATQEWQSRCHVDAVLTLR